MSSQKAPVSPVIEFIKVFNEMSARYGRSELWYDYIDMHAIALANTCDLQCRDAREEQYNAIVQKYDEKTVRQFAVLTAITMTALLENPEQDFLGTVYKMKAGKAHGFNRGMIGRQSRFSWNKIRAKEFHCVSSGRNWRIIFLRSECVQTVNKTLFGLFLH